MAGLSPLHVLRPGAQYRVVTALALLDEAQA